MACGHCEYGQLYTLPGRERGARIIETEGGFFLQTLLLNPLDGWDADPYIIPITNCPWCGEDLAALPVRTVIPGFKLRPGREPVWRVVRGTYEGDYCVAVLGFATRWARLLEEAIKDSGDPQTTIFNQAEDLAIAAATEGITGIQYNLAGSLLVDYWVYGDDLNAWHEAARPDDKDDR